MDENLDATVARLQNIYVTQIRACASSSILLLHCRNFNDLWLYKCRTGRFKIVTFQVQLLWSVQIYQIAKETLF